MEDADFVHRRFDQMWREVFQFTQVNAITEGVFSNISITFAFLSQWEVIYQKRVRVFHQGFQTPRNT